MVMEQASLPFIDVIVPAHNAAKHLERAVRSVWATAYPNLRLYVVDDGSSDGTAALARQLAHESPGRFTVLQHPGGARQGVSRSRNLAIETGESPWIAFLDADDEFLPNRFDSFLGFTGTGDAGDPDGAPGIDALYQMSVVEIEHEAEPDDQWRLGEVQSFGIAQDLRREQLLMRLLHSDTWAISALTVRRKALAAVGLFDPGLAIAEDCHLWIRLAAMRSVVAGCLERPVSIYHRHGSNTFRFNEENRIGFLGAAIQAVSAVAGLGASKETLDLMKSSIRGYAERTVVAAPWRRQRATAWKIVQAAIANRALWAARSGLLLRVLLNPRHVAAAGNPEMRG